MHTKNLKPLTKNIETQLPRAHKQERRWCSTMMWTLFMEIVEIIIKLCETIAETIEIQFSRKLQDKLIQY